MKKKSKTEKSQEMYENVQFLIKEWYLLHLFMYNRTVFSELKIKKH